MITLETDFDEYTPAYNPIEVVVSSDKTSEDSFRYIFDLVFIGGETIRFKVNPEPTTGNKFGVKDFHKIIESKVKAFINKSPELSPYGMTQMDGSLIQFHIEYGEEYDVAGTITEFPDLITGSTKYSWEGSLKYNEFVDYTFDIYDIDVNGDFLTDSFNNYIGLNNLGYSGVLTSNPTNVEFLQIKTYDINNVLIDTYRAVNPTNPASYGTRFLNVHTGTYNLNEISTLALGSQPIIDSAVARYTLTLTDASFNDLTSELEFIIKEQCNYPITRLLFENRYGAFDAFNFDLVRRDSVAIEKKSFKFTPNRLDGGGNLTYRKSDRTNVNYNIKSSTQIELNANWITEEQSKWLEDLFTSPEIYIENTEGGKGDKTLISVAEIQSNIYPIKTKKVDGLFNVDLVLTLSNNNYRQRK